MGPIVTLVAVGRAGGDAVLPIRKLSGGMLSNSQVTP